MRDVFPQCATLPLNLYHPLYSLSVKHFYNRSTHPIQLVIIPYKFALCTQVLPAIARSSILLTTLTWPTQADSVTRTNMYVVVVANYHNWCYSPYLPSSRKPTYTPFSNICKTTTSRYASLSGVMWSVSLTAVSPSQRVRLSFYGFKPMEYCLNQIPI